MANIQSFDKDVDIISQLADHPNQVDGLTADELKAKFDKAATLIKAYLNDVVVPAINELTEGLNAGYVVTSDNKFDNIFDKKGFYIDSGSGNLVLGGAQPGDEYYPMASSKFYEIGEMPDGCVYSYHSGWEFVSYLGQIPYGVALYDENKHFIKGTGYLDSYLEPRVVATECPNAKYFRVVALGSVEGNIYVSGVKPNEDPSYEYNIEYRVTAIDKILSDLSAAVRMAGEAVSYTSKQILSEDQQAQARENIDATAIDDTAESDNSTWSGKKINERISQILTQIDSLQNQFNTENGKVYLFQVTGSPASGFALRGTTYAQLKNLYDNRKHIALFFNFSGIGVRHYHCSGTVKKDGAAGLAFQFCFGDDSEWFFVSESGSVQYGTVPTATEAVGEAIGDIETALDAIIAIQNELQGNSTFTLYHTTDVTGEKSTYYYKEGMTWREWVASEYNVDGFDFDEADELRTTDGKYVNYTMEPVDGKLYIDDCVHPDTIIDPGKYFYSLE